MEAVTLGFALYLVAVLLVGFPEYVYCVHVIATEGVGCRDVGM